MDNNTNLSANTNQVLNAENQGVQNTNTNQNITENEQNITTNQITPSSELNMDNNNNNNLVSVQNDLQSIATVDQSNESFINNVQTASTEQEETSDGKMSYAFIFIIFAIIFAAIFYLFPMISKYI